MNKRALWLGSTALLTVTLLGTGLVSATGPTGDHGKSGDAHGKSVETRGASRSEEHTS